MRSSWPLDRASVFFRRGGAFRRSKTRSGSRKQIIGTRQFVSVRWTEPLVLSAADGPRSPRAGRNVPIFVRPILVLENASASAPPVPGAVAISIDPLASNRNGSSPRAWQTADVSGRIGIESAARSMPHFARTPSSWTAPIIPPSVGSCSAFTCSTLAAISAARTMLMPGSNRRLPARRRNLAPKPRDGAPTENPGPRPLFPRWRCFLS